jgi:hypothetical protein
MMLWRVEINKEGRDEDVVGSYGSFTEDIPSPH